MYKSRFIAQSIAHLLVRQTGSATSGELTCLCYHFLSVLVANHVWESMKPILSLN